MNRTNMAYLNFTLSHMLSLRDRTAASPATSEEEEGRARAIKTAVAIFMDTAPRFGIDLSYDHPNWEDVPDADFEAYIRTVFDTIRSTAADAEHAAVVASGDEDVIDPYSGNLRSVLSIMQTHARSLKLNAEIVDLAGYDSIRSELTTYRTKG